MRPRLLFAVAFSWLVWWAGGAHAENKLAFVVGIDAYPHLEAGAQLQRAVTDANAVGDALGALGFTVTRVTADATLDTLLSRFDTFTATIQAGDTVVFYYAGHGVSFSDGTYLIPADIPLLGPGDEHRARRLAIPEKDFSRGIRGAGARVVVMVIDACRDNPFPSHDTRSLGDGERGLTRIEPSEGVFSLYAAREGQTALDRLPGADADPDSVFTRVFLKDLKTPGISLSELGDRVRDEVADLAQTAGHDQVPAVYNDLRGSRAVFLNGAESESPRSRPAATPKPSVTRSGEQMAKLETAPDPSIAECDRLAAAPSDERRPSGVSGVFFSSLDAALAVPACRAAHVAAPNLPRISFQLGRSLDRAGNGTESADLYRSAAEALYPVSMANLGLSYQNGDGVARDAVVAVQWYRKAADAGNAGALTNLGAAYEDGIGSDAMGMNNLAALYAKGVGTATNLPEAVHWYQKAADAGLPLGMRNLGAMYENGSGVARDPAEAVRWYRKAADAGDAPGMAYLGVMYTNGSGVAKDPAEAVRWLQKAADAGDAHGMDNLGAMYANGSGVTKDLAEAARWIRKAAEAGDVHGMTNLGLMYASGIGVAKDPTEALRWFRKLADAGNADSMRNIGVMYEHGDGVVKDAAEAVRWYQKAADAGEAQGMINLGFMYSHGTGVAKNPAEAVRWYQKAADAGAALGMRDLGIMYEQGVGVTRDPIEAARWYEKAEAAGDPEAKARLERLRNQQSGRARRS